MSSRTSRAARWSAAAWSATCGSTGSGTRRGDRTRSPRTGASSSAPSASPSEVQAIRPPRADEPALLVAPAFAVVGRPQVDRRRLQRAAAVLGALGRHALALNDRLGVGRGPLRVFGLVVD